MTFANTLVTRLDEAIGVAPVVVKHVGVIALLGAALETITATSRTAERIVLAVALPADFDGTRGGASIVGCCIGVIAWRERERERRDRVCV